MYTFVLIGKREIKSLPVNCNSLCGHCDWKGTVGTFEDHIATCKFALHPCPKECDHQINKFTVTELEKHLESDCPNRDHKCEHCGRKGTYANITQNHDTFCAKKVVPCINVECTQTMRRLSLKRHLEYCEFSEVPCKYRKLGCHVKLKRLDIELHEQEDRSHLHMSLDTVAKLEDERRKTKEKISTLEDKLLKVTFKMTGYKDKKEANTLFESPFLTDPNGFKMHALIGFNHLNDDGDIVSSRRSDPTHIIIIVSVFTDEDEPTSIGQFHFALLNQLENENHYNTVFNLNLSEGGGHCFSESDFISLDELGYDPDSNTQYLKDDTLYFRMSVEADYKPWLMCTAKRETDDNS